MPRTAAPTLSPPPPLPLPPPPAAGRDASVVLRSVLDHGPVARSTIARLTGLSPASVTDYCARFTELGLIREASAPRRSNGVGRPHVPVDLDDSRFVVGGVHVAVPYTTVALLDLRGRVVARASLKHERDRSRPGAGAGGRRAGGAAGRRARLPTARRRRGPGGWVTGSPGPCGASDAGLAGRGGARGASAGVPGCRSMWTDTRGRWSTRSGCSVRRGSSGSVLHLFVGNVVDAAFATNDEVHHGPRSQAGAIAHLPVPGSTERCAAGGPAASRPS